MLDIGSYEIQQAGRVLTAIRRFAGDPQDKGLLAKIKGEVSDAESLILSEHAVLSQDPRGILNFYNRGASLVFGYEKPEIIGKETRILVPDDMMEDRAEMFSEAISQGRLVVEKTIRQHMDGTRFPIRGYVFPYELEGERCIAAVVEKI